jgi:hypothetical protein
MTKRQHALVQLETLLAAMTALLGFVTIFWRSWIEVITGWDPDHHSGAVEVFIVIGLLALSVILGLMAKATKQLFTQLNSAS